MRLKKLSVKNLCLLIGGGTLLTMLLVTAVLYNLSGDIMILSGGAALILCALGWQFLLVFRSWLF